MVVCGAVCGEFCGGMQWSAVRSAVACGGLRFSDLPVYVCKDADGAAESYEVGSRSRFGQNVVSPMQ